MHPITWLVAVYNRKWQRDLDTMVMESVLIEEPQPIDDDLCLMRDMVNQVEQPTHLAHTFQARARRKKSNTKPKPSLKEEALQEAMDEEFKRMAEGR